MAHVTLKEVLSESVEKNYAIGAFAGMDLSIAEQIIRTSEQLRVPVILLLYGPYVFGKKNDDRKWFEVVWEMLDRASVPVSMILDHGSYTDCHKAIDYGFKSVMFDGSSLPIEENIAKTKEIVDFAHARGISVEGEIGHVGGNEGTTEAGEVKKDHFTKPDDAKFFADATGVDALAIAIGSKHGVYAADPVLDLERLDLIREAVGCLPLVMHGGSGIPDKMMRASVDHGINKINYVTYMMLAAADAARASAEKEGHVTFWEDMAVPAYNRIDKELRHEIEVFKTKELLI